MSFVRPGGATRVRADTQHKIRLQCEDFKRWTEMNPNHWRSAWSILKWPQKHVQIVQVAIIVVRIKSDNFSWRQEFCAIFAVFSDFSLPFLLSQLLLLDCFLLQALEVQHIPKNIQLKSQRAHRSKGWFVWENVHIFLPAMLWLVSSLSRFFITIITTFNVRFTWPTQDICNGVLCLCPPAYRSKHEIQIINSKGQPEFV